jgi:hypothetical protein
MKKFTIVSRPNYEDINRQNEWKKNFPVYNKKSFSTRLMNDNNGLIEAIKTLEERSIKSEFFLELIHPKSPNLSTVCVWKYQERDDKYYIKHSEDLIAFNNSNNNNLLYLPTLRDSPTLRRETLIDFYNITDNETYRYQVIEPKELGFPDSLFSKKSDVSGVFFKQVKSNEGVDPVRINLEEIEEDSENEYHAVGWLNPVILTLDVEGDDIEHIQNASNNEYLNALSLFFDRSSLILVEPHINESYDLRISFLIKLYQTIEQENQSRNKNLSLIEYMLLGSQCSQPWKPFLILDLLGGEFYAYQNVWQDRDREQLLVSWKSPQDATSNKHWFAGYWLNKWVSSQKINIQGKVNVVSPPSLARPYRSNVGLVTLQIDDLSKTTPSLTSLLKGHPLYISDSEKNNPYHFLVKLFEDPEVKKYSDTFPYDNFWHRLNQNNQSVKFDDLEFFNYFSKNHVIPESPILIAIPNQEDNRFLDPINSLKFGAYHFLWKLFKFNCFDSDRERELVKFSNSFGWWNDWHSTIFNERSDVCLKFIRQSGFIIGQSLIGGEDRLGLKTKGVDWNYPNMRFSSPTTKK